MPGLKPVITWHYIYVYVYKYVPNLIGDKSLIFIHILYCAFGLFNKLRTLIRSPTFGMEHFATGRFLPRFRRNIILPGRQR
jgi:hypothetical protein